MRILHLTSHLDVGGVSQAILSLSKELAARGHQAILASGGGQLETRAAALGLTHWRVPLATSQEFSPQVFAAIGVLAARLRKEPVDLLHGHTRVGQVAAARLSRALRRPYVATWHGFFTPNLGRRLWPCTGEVTIAISEPVRQHLVRVFRVPSARIRMIPHGVDPTPFESPVEPSERQRLRDHLGLSAEGPVVGTVARLVPSKGVDHLIRALRHVRALVPKVRLLLVGDGIARPALERLARAEGVADVVRFAGALPETRTVLSLMDVFIFLPEEEEGFGLSLLEAMASACPIVAVNRGGGATWVLEESGVGTKVASGDDTALAAAIADYLRYPQLARRAGEHARMVAKIRYPLARMVDQVEAVYRELVPVTSHLPPRP